jgi:hypothetical protein
MNSGWLATVLIVITGPVAMPADTTAFTKEHTDFFESRIRPILVEHCQKCHSTESAIIKGGLRLDHRDGLLKGGDSGPAAVPGKPEDSLIIKALRHTELRMPPKGKLPEQVVRDFEQWIKDGMADPRRAHKPVETRKIDIEQGRKFWAFQPVKDSPPPRVSDDAWPLDPIDRFIRQKQDEKGIHPVKDAGKHLWLRRVTIDLTGLPPTPADISSFLGDIRPGARERVVDRLLASRAYGERWARHWLDLTGYADMMGTSNNVYAEHAWRYRDYLIGAFQKDKPFNRFILEQVAGDLLPAGSAMERAENITATGFLMVGDVEIVEPDKAKMEADHVDTQVSKIGTAFLGMTLGCVRCHDHKFDPIGLEDYYGIAGMLRSSPSTHKIPFGVWSQLNASELPETAEQLAARREAEAQHERKIVSMVAERENLAAKKKAVESELAATKNDDDRKAGLAKQRDDLAERIKKVAAAIVHAEFFRSKAPMAYAMGDGANPSDMPIHIRGNPYAPGRVVPRGVVRVATDGHFPPIPEGQSGRLQLARWLADNRNPLTARVTVNRIWQKLFGEGIVTSVDYFGARGEKPSHPELLDHLAFRFMAEGWSQKKLIRAIVLTRTYGLGSGNSSAALETDPDNRLLWRMNRLRLDAEAIRDGLLAVSGELTESVGGPALVLEEVENCGSLASKGVNPPNYTHRKPRTTQEFQRTIYLPVMRNNPTADDRIRAFFDFVNPAQISGQRSRTVAPTQSLFAMNNDLFRKRAKSLAGRLMSRHAAEAARMEDLWLAVYNRPITPAEREEAGRFLRETHERAGGARDAETTAWIELCHALLASNEFVFRL